MKSVYFDLETTGANTDTDRIVQLGIIVTNEVGEVVLEKQRMLNPDMPISPEATAIHGIRDEDVVDQPKFWQVAKALKGIFEDAVLIGYNSMAFDIPMLLAEFDRAKIEINLSGKFLDVFKIEKKLSPRTLADTYKKYTGNELVGAHDAMADIRATKEILDAQTEIIGCKIAEADAAGVDNAPTIEDALYYYSDTNNLIDFYGKFDRNKDGWLTFKFGKHKDKRVVDEVQYADWMLESNFPSQVKKLIREDRARELKEKLKK